MQHNQRIRQAFGHAAHQYNANAALQHAVAAHTAKIAVQTIAPEIGVLDAGAGTGFVAQALHGHYMHMLGLDSAFPMCKSAVTHYPAGIICGDMSALPLADATLGGIISSLALQWAEPQATLREWARVTATNGHAVIATFGPETLHELAAAFRRADGDARINPFPSRDALMDYAQVAGWRVESCTAEVQHLVYPHLTALLHSLKAIGATTREVARKGLTAPSLFRAAEAHYYASSSCAEGLKATWQMYYLVLKREDEGG